MLFYRLQQRLRGRRIRGRPFRWPFRKSGREAMTDRATIRGTLIELLEADTGEKYSDLADDAKLREGLGLDSVDVVSIVSQIERRFHIRLTHEELEKLVTVADVLNLLESKLNTPPQSQTTAA
jgi:acyl carrier protein